MQRRPTPELLDTDSGTAEEVAAALLDLESLNRHLGGTATTRDLIYAVARTTASTELSLLETASGNGFVPTDASCDLSKRGITVQTTLLDRALTHLPPNGGSQKVVADSLTLPFADSAFDLVSCSLFTHHLSPARVVQFVREALRVSRVAVLINDLVRHPLHLALAYAGTPLYRSRLTRHDAPASVKQAYTVEEMRGLLLRSGARDVVARKYFLYRMGVIAWK
jgi:ubiquinone/menaquinone biosynthesis C-methylase UbiE